MKRAAGMLVALCLLVLLPQQLSGQSSHRTLQATIPFSFQVGDVVLPEGTYLFTVDSKSPSVVWISGGTPWRRIAVFTHDIDSEAATRLVFRQAGGVMVLHQVFPGDGNHSHDVIHVIQNNDV